ncbi:unnamed protein product, partial [Sphacelaria rigidula]
MWSGCLVYPDSQTLGRWDERWHAKKKNQAADYCTKKLQKYIFFRLLYYFEYVYMLKYAWSIHALHSQVSAVFCIISLAGCCFLFRQSLFFGSSCHKKIIMVSLFLSLRSSLS